MNPERPTSDSRSIAVSRIGVISVVVAILLLLGAVWWATASNRDDATPPNPAPSNSTPAGASTSADPDPSWTPSAAPLPKDVTAMWAYLDSTDGTHSRQADTDLHPVDRLIVPAAAQLLADRTVTTDPSAGPSAEPSVDPATVSLISSALAQNATAGDELVKQAGGEDTTFGKVIDVCSLDDAKTGPARATVLQVAQYAACLREGAITDPDHAAWSLDLMRTAAGGIGDVRGNDGGQRLAQFNSTVPAGEDRNRTWCMGIGAYWSGAVLVDWPASRGELYGVAACAQVAKAEFPPDTQKAPESNPPTPADPSRSCPYDTCRGTD
jgi:hypothetical protein